MDEIIYSMISSYANAFDAYPVASPTLQQEIDSLKARLYAFGEANGDVTTFHQRFAASGLQEEYMAVITKAVMAASGTANADGSPVTDYSDREVTVMSVADFVAQYRTPYNEVRAAGYRKRGEAAYEAIFNVANRTDSMVEAQLIFERERLLWKIVTEDALDIFEPVLEAMDPLHTATTILLRQQIEAYRTAQSEEELIAMIERQEYPRAVCIRHAVCKITVAALLATQLLGYCTAKKDVWKWRNDIEAKGGVMGMSSCRAALRRMLALLQEEWGLTFDDLCADESIKIWMLAPANADALGRIKTALTPRNIDAFRDIVHNEILPDIPIRDILLRRVPVHAFFSLTGAQENMYKGRAQQRAAQLNANLTYYQYMKQLDAAYSAQLGQAAPSPLPFG